MKLPTTPTGMSTILTLTGWLRTLTASIAAGWSVEHTATGTHQFPSGTWTPKLLIGGSNTGLTFSARSGTYTKIGRVVIASGSFTLSAVGSSTGAIEIAGLPFRSSVGSTHSGLCAFGTNWAAGINSPLTGYIASASTTMVLFRWAATGVVNIYDTDLTATTSLGFTVIYQAAS